MEKRIRELAAQMDRDGLKNFGYAVPHSVFVEWDQTWDVARDDYHYDENTSDDLLIDLITDQEASHSDGYYAEEYEKYCSEHNMSTQKMVESLAQAFCDGYNETACPNHEFPMMCPDLYDDEARTVLDAEIADFKLRTAALGEFMCINEIDSWDVEAKDCPLVPEAGISTEGGKLFAEHPDAYTAEIALQKCLDATYYSWFAKKYFGN